MVSKLREYGVAKAQNYTIHLLFSVASKEGAGVGV